MRCGSSAKTAVVTFSSAVERVTRIGARNATCGAPSVATSIWRGNASSTCVTSALRVTGGRALTVDSSSTLGQSMRDIGWGGTTGCSTRRPRTSGRSPARSRTLKSSRQATPFKVGCRAAEASPPADWRATPRRGSTAASRPLPARALSMKRSKASRISVKVCGDGLCGLAFCEGGRRPPLASAVSTLVPGTKDGNKGVP